MTTTRTDSERYLAALCERTFLSLWSVTSVHRDQGSGSEICDLLVVFGDHVVVFSDKDCDFPDTGDLVRDWSRWFRRSILDSAKQIAGAERWLREHPGRVFIDQSCTTPIHLALPAQDRMVVHRVAVTHKSAARCRREFRGGSGSLFFNPNIIGAQQCVPETLAARFRKVWRVERGLSAAAG